jgi:hypothetical protein
VFFFPVKGRGDICFTFYLPDAFPELFFFKISISEKPQECILFTFYFLEHFPELFFFKIFFSGKLRGCILFTFYFLGKQQGRKMLRPYPIGQCLGSISVPRWTHAPGHVSFLDVRFQRSTSRQ